MKLTITIPDDQIPELRRMAIEATQAEGRTITPTTLAGQMVTAAILADLDERAEMASALAHQSGSLEARKLTTIPIFEATPENVERERRGLPLVPSIRELPPVARPTFGPLGGANLDDDELLRRTLEATQRKRAELGLDSSGLAPEQAATRAAVQGTGARPLGDLPAKVRAGKLDAGKVPPKTELQ
jgi:hypothetical protein